MTDTWTETDRDDYFSPEGFVDDDDYSAPPPNDDNRSYSTIFDAPDYASFVKKDQTAKSKEYEQKVASMLKALALGAFKSGDIPDGAAILHHGKSFSKAAGDLTDVSEKAQHAIDILTAPDNPWFVFATMALPFAMQIARNHEKTAAQVRVGWREARRERKRMKAEGLLPPKSEGTPITIKGPFGKKFTFRVRLGKPLFILNVFRSQTKDPVDLVTEVMSDEKLRKALAKEGITVTVRRNSNG